MWIEGQAFLDLAQRQLQLAEQKEAVEIARKVCCAPSPLFLHLVWSVMSSASALCDDETMCPMPLLSKSWPDQSHEKKQRLPARLGGSQLESSADNILALFLELGCDGGQKKEK